MNSRSLYPSFFSTSGRQPVFHRLPAAQATSPRDGRTPQGIFLASVFALLVSIPAHADKYPHFDEAKPILRMQPRLLEYVRSHFEVRDTGIARIPGNPDRPPQPPFIFQARPRGSTGPYYLTLLIQPGPDGRILKVVDSRRRGYPAIADPNGAPHPAQPPQPPPETANAPEALPAPTAPAAEAPQETPPPSDTSSGPTADTPSGPLNDDGKSVTPLPPAPGNSSDLAPPADSAPNK